MDAAVALQRKKTIKFLCIVDFLKDPTQCELLVETVYCVAFFISAKP